VPMLRGTWVELAVGEVVVCGEAGVLGAMAGAITPDTGVLSSMRHVAVE